ncbi:MAG: sialate O-acetylesterase [Clostridia bacterium]|nr:sialate O-acetylesterase [Clostridia bacterium]
MRKLRYILWVLLLCLPIKGLCAPDLESSKAAALLENLPSATAKVFTVAGVFTDHMVLQRDREITVWGTCLEEGAILHVIFAGNVATAVVQNGQWEVKLPPMAASNTPKTLEIIGGAESEHIFLENVLVGDVWWIMGQSNVEYSATTIDGWFTLAAKLPKNARVMTYNSRDLIKDTMPDGFTGQKRIWRPMTDFSAAPASAIGVCFTERISAGLGEEVPLGLISMGFRGQDLAMFVPPALAETTTAVGEKSVIYEKAIQNMEKLAVRGLIWYQGEANGMTYATYVDEFDAFITYLREQMGPFPVYIVELSPCFPPMDGVEGWQYLDFGMVRGEMGTIPMHMQDVYILATSDLWTSKTYPNSLHPPNKMAVAERLANAVLANEYDTGDADMCLSATLSSIRFGENKQEAILTFDHVKNALSTFDGNAYIKGFSALDKSSQRIEDVQAFVIDAKTVRVTAARPISVLEYGCQTEDVFGETITLQDSTNMPVAAFRVTLEAPDIQEAVLPLRIRAYAFLRNHFVYVLLIGGSIICTVTWMLWRRNKRKNSR